MADKHMGVPTGMVHSPAAFYQELCKLIDLPKNCISIDIRIRLNEVPEIECRYYVTPIDGEEVTKRFQIVEIKAPEGNADGR